MMDHNLPKFGVVRPTEQECPQDVREVTRLRRDRDVPKNYQNG